MKPSKFGVPVINVGNLSMGGTGKTPHVEYLIRLLKDNHKLATLSRGFGRTERGFQIADENSTAAQMGDEPLQYFKKFGSEVIVSVEADRVLGAMDLFRVHEDIEVLLLDDAFQHRKIHADLNILLTDYSAPYYSDFILPVGNLRESRKGRGRADAIVVTKCPTLTEADKAEIIKRLKPAEKQEVFFSKIVYGSVHMIASNEEVKLPENVILVSGIANADPLVNFLEESTNILKHFRFGDHHKFKESELKEIHNIFDKFVGQNPLIITTEKDAMRLLEHDLSDYPWSYQSMEVQVDDKERFDTLIKQHVKKDN